MEVDARVESSSVVSKSEGNVTLVTSMGDIELELYWKHAPKTCLNFRSLAMRKYYDGTIFHRIVAGFCIQGGDPSGTGKGGTSIFGDSFADEIHPDLRHTGAGILSMANSGPNSNSSQFFLTLGVTSHLDGKHTIFGRVKSGMRVVQRMSMVAVDSQHRPKDPVTIYRAVGC